MKSTSIALLILAASVLGHAEETTAPQTPPATAASRLNTPTPYSAPIQVPSAAGQLRLPSVPAPEIRIQPPPPPTFNANCDSTGCWGSDGRRYDASSGSLLRSDGRPCQSVAGVLQCP